jgi:hypothetical protein
MASLSAHLRESGDHGRLAFHPGCPVCRDERLVGALPADAIVSRRTQALLAAGVLALSSAAPTAAFAQAEPDQEQEGTAAPEETTPGDPASDPDFDPGGESTDLPFDAGPPPDAHVAPDPDDDAGALEQEPTTNEDAPVADIGDEASTQRPDGQQPPSTPGTAPPPPPTPLETPEAVEPAPAPEEPTATPAPSDPEAVSPTHARTRDDTRKRPRRSQAHAPSPTVPSDSAPEPEPVIVASEPSEATTVHVVQEPSTSTPTTVAAGGRAARPGDRFHVVLAGESLWSIANDVLGAEASVANIAREVNRLWALNSERIGTGDRDLLLVGTRLALR